MLYAKGYTFGATRPALSRSAPESWGWRAGTARSRGGFRAWTEELNANVMASSKEQRWPGTEKVVIVGEE